MAAYNYLLENFLATPSPGDTRMKIYDKTSVLKHSVEPQLAFFFARANVAVLKLEDRADIELSFVDAATAILALARLNEVKTWFVEQYSQTCRGDVYFSTTNLNMVAKTTSSTQTLACDSVISDVTYSFVRVIISEIEVRVGDGVKTSDCYFSSDGGSTAKTLAQHRRGDSLYWNGAVAGFELDPNDRIDFLYLTR